MHQANIAFVNMFGKRYAVDLLNPMDAISWGNRALALFGPALGKIFGAVDFDKLEGIDLEKMGLTELGGRIQGLVATMLASCGELKHGEVSGIMTEAIQRCYTPQNESLGDAVVFNRWFREHPGDLYPLGVMALVYLVKDFFPSQLVTVASKFQARMTAETENSP